MPFYLLCLLSFCRPLMTMNFGFKKLQVFLSGKFFQQDFAVVMPTGLKTQKALALDNL